MSRVRMVLEADSDQLFEMMAKMKGDGGPLGERLAGLLLTGRRDTMTEIGLGVYGVEVVELAKSPERDEIGPGDAKPAAHDSQKA